MTDKQTITIEATVNANVETVWSKWTNPNDIVKWNTASDDWHTTKAENDLVVGGKFSSRMEAKDGSFGFDFWGIYTHIIPNELIEYTMGDDRKASVKFSANNGQTTITTLFEAEDENPIEMQQFGWQAILNNFKKYAEI
ncbi:MAG: SRPBCC family protein [Bacteroidia bacterium]